MIKLAWNKKEEDRRKIKPISFSDEDGHKALEWLETKKGEKGGMSGYITKLILADKEKTLKEGE